MTTRTDGVAPVLQVRNLSVAYQANRQWLDVVHDVSFDLWPGESLGIVGESGSGKSTAILGVAGLVANNGRVTEGSVTFAGQELVGASREVMRSVHGPGIGMLYQDSLRALNPVMRIGDQISEVFVAHGVSGDHMATAVELLTSVGIPEPERRIKQYPHQLSGGMRQRVMTAIALAMSPKVLLADEPTTALDVTIQAQILELIKQRATATGTATVLVSHDLGVIAGLCERVMVMYGGRLVEQGPSEQIFADPKHPYTAALLEAVPRVDVVRERLRFIAGQAASPGDEITGCRFAPRCDHALDGCSSERPILVTSGERAVACIRDGEVGFLPQPVARTTPSPVPAPAVEAVRRPGDDSDLVMDVRGVTRHYPEGRGRRRTTVRAVDGVNLDVRRGEFLSLVGESGCGKSTLGRLLVGLEEPDSGSILLDGRDASGLSSKALRQRRRSTQMVFQDPRSSLNRRMTVGDQLAEALAQAGVSRPQRAAQVAQLLDQVGLPAEAATRLPIEFSGGQAQRIAIARALGVRPSVLVADEAVSSLDVSVKGQIVNLLRDLQESLGLTIVFISHDLGVVRQVSDRVAVMYLGQIIEVQPADELFADPRHPYTQSLLSAIPIPDPVIERQRTRIVLTGDVPSPTSPPPGCRFHARCPVGPSFDPSRSRCRTEVPALVGGVACHFAHVEGGQDA